MVRKLGLLATLTMILMIYLAPIAFAAEAEAAAGDDSANVKVGLAIASGFAIAIAAFGGALAQGKSVSAALDGIARNPGASGKIMTPMILGLALIETLVIYALVVALLLQGKI